MADSSQDPWRNWWRRLRIPLGLLVVIGIVIESLDTLGTGEPRAIVGTAAWIGFWGWLFLRPMTAPMSDPPTAAQLRSRDRPMLVASGIWTVVFILLISWGSLDRGSLSSRALLPLVCPLLLLISSWFGFARAEWIATKVADAHARRK